MVPPAFLKDVIYRAVWSDVWDEAHAVFSLCRHLLIIGYSFSPGDVLVQHMATPSTLEIVRGDQRVDVARALGMKEVPVLFLRDLTEAEKTRIRIADNGGFGVSDIARLRLQIESMPQIELPLLDLGAMTLDAVMPLPAQGDDGGLQADEKWEQVKFKLPKAEAQRVNSVIEQVCAKQKCRPGTALTYIVELFAQDSENGIE